MRMSPSSLIAVLSSALMLLSFSSESNAFTVAPIINNRMNNPMASSSRFVSASTSTSSSRLYALPDVGSMKVGEIRQELESYGISTRSFLEKREFIQALEKARAEGKTPVNDGKTKANGFANGSSTSSSTSGSKKSSTSSKKSADTGPSRSERIKLEKEQAKSMKVGELKKKLNDMGISTKSFFEKSEFVKAYAEAMVDGAKKAGGASSDEPLDSSYRDVMMQKFDNTQQRMLSGTVIDIKLK